MPEPINAHDAKVVDDFAAFLRSTEGKAPNQQRWLRIRYGVESGEFDADITAGLCGCPSKTCVVHGLMPERPRPRLVPTPTPESETSE